MIGKKINQLATELAPVSTDLTIIGDPTTGVSKKITLAQLGAIFSGAVSFYTNLAGFPATGDINVIYCAKDTQKLYLWSGSAYVEVFPSQALLDTYQLRSEKGNANGYASLDSQGKVPISQLPSSIMEYKGTWNASTNTPTLANGTGDTGDVYICNVAGTVNFGAGPITFAVGDYVIYSGSIWQRSSGAVGTVTSVAVSRSGDALAITGSPVTTSGTINIGFAGNSTQYINGAGNLVTFPGVINEAQNLITEVYNKTGATLTKGTVVYINGGQGNLPAVTKALATGDSTSAQTYGIVRNDITNNNNGYVVVAGRISDLDTQAYTEGTQLYLSPTTAGTFTSTKPYAPQHLVYVGIVVRAHPTQGVVEVKIQNGYELDELHNVAAQSPTNNDGLFWEASTSLWKNKSIATILGYTPQAQLNGTGFVKASGTSISYDNSTYLTTSAAATTYLPLVLSSTANVVDINGQQFNIWGSAGGYTSGRIIIDPVFSAIGYQNAGVFDGLKILTNGNAEFSNSGVTRFFNQVRFDSTLTNGTYTYTLPGATGTIALVGGAGVGTVTSVSALTIGTSGTDISSTVANSTTTPVITLNVPTASATNRGALSSTDWTTFNNKQNALTNPVTGTGTTNYLPKFTGASTIGNSTVFDNGSFVGIGRTTNASAGWNLAVQNGLTVTQGTTETQLFGYFGDAGVGTFSNHNFKIRVNNTDRAIFDTSGNLGLGVTPSAWTDYKVLQFGGGSISSYTDNLFIEVNQNAFWNGSSYVYVNNGFASRYQQNVGRHEWYTAPSGTATNAISFTQAMTLDASGRLMVGSTVNDGRRLTLAGNSNDLAGIGITYQGVAASSISVNSSGSMLFGLDGADGKTTRLTIASTGAATFSSSVTTGGNVSLEANEAYVNLFSTYSVGLNARARIRAVGAGGGSGYGGDFRVSTRATNNVWNDDAFIVDYLGRVGIGTTSPQSIFHIGASAPANSGVKSYTGLSASYEGFLFDYYYNTSASNVRVFDIAALGFAVSGAGGSEMRFLTVPQTTTNTPIERMRITSAGNVLIGTTTGHYVTINRTVLNINGTSSSILGLQAGNTTAGYLYADAGDFTISTESTRNLNLVTAGSAPMVFQTNSTERMRITSGGNVEINTGSIKTGEPDTGWGRAAIKIGASVSGAAFNVTRYLPVSVDGTVYYINLNSSTP